MKTRIARAFVGVASISLAPAAYAVGIDRLLPASGAAAWFVPETFMVALQGVVLLAVAHAIRRQRSSTTATPAPTTRLTVTVSRTVQARVISASR